jgi:hypothetical protein
MAILAERVFRRGGRPRPCRVASAWLILAAIIFVPGCIGCRRSSDTDPKAGEKLKKKEKDPFEARQPVVIPTASELHGMCKPGHWFAQSWPDVQANRGDFQGDLLTQVIDGKRNKVQLGATPFEMTTQRPAVLAKEQAKSLEAFNYVPPPDDKSANAAWVDFRLAGGSGSPTAHEGSMTLTRLRSFQYFFVVVSRVTDRYQYLEKNLASFHLRRTGIDEDEGPKLYEVVSIPASRRPSLPTNSLYWTSIAYLLWDDCDPGQWDIDQQRALIDWLHWGGQIIVSGPEALEQLRGSFLQPFLPAAVEKSRSLGANDLAELQYWAGEVGLPPKPVKPWPGANLRIDPRAKYVPQTGDLVVERQIGRGRIVATAFRLTGSDLTRWAGCDSFFNACLLRRPARVFQGESTWFTWNDGKPGSLSLDAARMTGVRYFARDAGAETGRYAADVIEARQSALGSGFAQQYLSNENFPVMDQKFAPGLGAWNDYNSVAQAARKALENAEGISVPDRSFIIWVVAGYVLVLVPANWLVFRLLRRVEWAWIAAPLIAIACTVVVIKQAQLNLGFGRTRNEIAVVELQPGYSRAHVARYTSLYTSLAARYEFHLDDAGGQILPFPRDASPEGYKPGPWQSNSELICRRGEDTQLSGFRVNSNDFDYIHSEEMVDFGGSIALHRDSDGTLRVTNATKHSLEGCQVIRGGKSGVRDLARFGRLEPGATTKALSFSSDNRQGTTKVDDHPQAFGSTYGETPSRSPEQDRAKATDLASELSLEGIEQLAVNGQELLPGEICLLARVADNVPGLTVTPEASQTREVALLVAHLDPGELPTPSADARSADTSPLSLVPGVPQPPRARVNSRPLLVRPDGEKPTPATDDE